MHTTSAVTRDIPVLKIAPHGFPCLANQLQFM
ncbi:hypothetical protein DVU_0798 [Nitratidesulfovibrio vulgaris str. Hildenborough]|uniref:Uncharacterized protein n=1 Tax=Nitratidesulfovibrio vulgaris (strain ATCC 29579 / DSM 644 / CCUG 34227 / NCIMB 8303 / VKM B-1760 / Hildenborough) TaxID=882 RepID=Q72DY1_NITV2|nr:hypothetical protein DVU_0798 [Nitratidesulfovibrio vulgaris str. Hildenborough]